ncbi:MAG TPA: protein kinase [Thermoanaerobaculia bacterium]|nr:protein kinase [Thermoanaerobaculia bacterium]
MIGSTVSRYKVLERLGGGGAGVVYKAEDTRLERLVALKFLSSYRAGNEADQRRFLREARVSSALDHPNICTVYEVDETDDGRLFIAMALCEGETLKRRIERGELPLAEAVDVAAQIAAGLAAAHAKGIVHRDVKPANVIVAPDGRVKIVDFGIAKLPDQSRLTRDGTAVGTAGYMAPEQIRGDTIDARTDVWALGVVLYEMVTARSPFPAETDHDRIRGILSRDPEPLVALRRDVPQAIDRIVARALAKRPEDRYARMEEMRADLLHAAESLGFPGFQDGFDPTIRDIPSGFSRPRTATEETGMGLAGQIVAHYRVLELLGGGGMGVVYKAEDLRLNRTVALKFLPPELTRDPEAKARFLQEARSASVLDHPNICTIHEVGETDDGRLYLAMPSYDGETLRKRIERGPLPIDEATDVAQQIARGLSKAHRHGIVHRDIKPANLIVTSDGVVKILDFGLAKLAGSAALTRTGSSVGTPAYMSPEQARGEEVDHRADLWSLGIVLYEMVAGRRPFRGEHEQAVLYSLLNESPRPLHELRPEAPPELERIVAGLLAKDPGDRYPTVDGPLGDLTALRNESMTTTVRTQPGDGRAVKTPVWLWPASLAVVAALIAGGLWLWVGRRPSGQAAQAVRFTQLTDLEGSESFPSLSPDGKSFVYVKVNGGNRDIFFRPVAGGTPRDLTEGSPADDTQPAFSPDGTQIAFRSERDGGGLFLMGVTGGAVRQLTDAGFNPAWSPDGTKIAYATEGVASPRQRRLFSQISVVEVATGKTRVLEKDDGVQPSWSPHGRRIAYWGVPAGSSERILYTVAAEGGAPVQAVRDGHVNWNPVWSADGRALYYVSDRSGIMNIWQLPLDEATGEPQGEPKPVTPSSQSLGLLSLAGRQIAYATDEGKSNVERWSFDPATFKVAEKGVPVTQGSRSVRSAAVSPDGSSIAFDTSAPQEDLYVVKPDGTGQRQLTDDAAKDRIPQWFAGGTRLLFYSDRGGSYGAWTIGADGHDLRRLENSNRESLTNPIPSPDGRRVVASFGAKGAAFLDLAGDTLQWLPQPEGGRKLFAPHAWSPDGQYLAGTLEQADESGVPGIVVYSLAANRYDRLTDTGTQPVWLHDSRTLLYLQEGKVFRVRLGEPAPRLLVAPPESSAFKSLAVAPDDRTLYIVRATDEGDIYMATFQSGPGPSGR